MIETIIYIDKWWNRKCFLRYVFIVNEEDIMEENWWGINLAHR